MSTIFIIRHGQASFGAADYDQLSDLGKQQARDLGRYLADFGISISHLYIGPRKRHRQTATCMQESLGDHAIKHLVDAPEWDEFPAFEVIARGLPKLVARLPPQMAERFLAGAADPVGQRDAFEDMFRHTIRAWVEGELEVPECETYPAFHARIEAAIHRLMTRHGRGKTIAVVTSAGPVAASARTALDLAPWTAMKLSLTIANSAFVELRYRDDQPNLTGFNRGPHLSTRALWTYR